MATFSGHLCRIELASIAAPTTYVPFSKFVREVDWSWPAAVEDTTPLEAGGKEEHLDLISDDLMIRFHEDDTAAAWLFVNSRQRQPNVQIGIKWYPLGNSTGRSLYTGSGIVKQPQFRAPDGAIQLSCTFHVNPNQTGGLAWAISTI